ncbi:MAG: hypothetical protein Q4C00_05675 [Bacillota bacterium]|nr:hypothetical protein [Bacillota bacterium]
MSYYRQFPQFNNELAICVDNCNAAGMEGRAYFGSEQEPVLFRDVCAVLISYNDFLDVLQAPQASTELRVFRNRKAKIEPLPRGEVLSLKSRTQIREMGKKSTFMVRVEYRQNSSWQGKVTWVETGETKSFRSALELLMLMESAMSEDGDEREITLVGNS